MNIKAIKKHIVWGILFTIHCSLFTSCIDEDEHDNTPQGNFEALWKIVDEHYCFFDYKQHEYGLDWNAVYNKYNVRAKENLNREQLFEVLTDMLAELKDGHVNLSTAFDYGRYWSWYEDYPANFSDTLQRIYLDTDYRIAANIQYTILDDNIGYVYCGSFQNGFGEGNLDEVIQHLILCNGLILDIRNNGGGNLTYAEKLAARFCHEKTLVGYLQHKTGKGHNDFSEMKEQYIEPSSNLRWQKPVVVLTNRHVFSAANEFVKYMKCFPQVKVVGDRTGGGAGLPFSSTLPNGWTVRFSACPMYDRQRQQTEFGIEPDYPVSQKDADFADGKDTLIEFARKLLVE
ncbi:MAG: S41 family peptidase [Prevotella sp.]|nr:S41 family peptidase [Prevotella sp.]